MKKNKQGFVLVEAIIVISIITAISIALYTFTISTIHRYSIRDRYNTPRDLYKLGNIRNYILRNRATLPPALFQSSPANNCLAIHGTAPINIVEPVFRSLLREMNVHELFWCDGDLTNFRNANQGVGAFPEFVRWLNPSNTNPTGEARHYRLIGVFNNGSDPRSFASIRVMP